MARQAPAGLLGIHVNMPATVPADVAKAINNGDPAPARLTAVEKAAFALSTFFSKNGYGAMMTPVRKPWLRMSDSPSVSRPDVRQVRPVDL